MNRLKPLFLLVQRPLTLFGAILWMIIAAFLAGNLVKPGGVPDMALDAAFLTVLVLSGYSGMVIGAGIAELQQSSFAFTLPGVQVRHLPGFLFFGGVSVLAAVALVVGNSPYPQNGFLLFVVGMGAYCLGASFRDPESPCMTGLAVALMMVLISTTSTLAQFAAAQPWTVAAVSAMVAASGIHRRFSKKVFRSLPLGKGGRVLAFSVEQVQQTAKNRRLSYGPKNTRWSPAYLGAEPRGWLRAAWYESYGGFRFRSVVRAIGHSWGLFLVLLLEAQFGPQDVGFWKSLCWSVHDAILRSPHSPEFGEKGGPFVLVALAILLAGASMAVFHPVALNERLIYPLSRKHKSDVMFNGSTLDMAILLLIVAPGLLLLGHALGWVMGFESRFDYMPFYFRVILITLVLLPLAYWGKLQVQTAAWRKDPYSMVGVSMGMLVFVLAGSLLVYLSSHAFESGVIELLVLVAGILISRSIYRRFLTTHYRTADLG